MDHAAETLLAENPYTGHIRRRMRVLAAVTGRVYEAGVARVRRGEGDTKGHPCTYQEAELAERFAAP